MTARIPKGAPRIPKGAPRIPKGAAGKVALWEVQSLQRVTLLPVGGECLSTFSTLSTGGEAPPVLADARHRGARLPHPAPHVPQQDGRRGIIREGVREEAPQRGELAGIVRQGQQANDVGELSVGHASTVRRRVTWASRGTARGTPGERRQPRSTRACARARGLGGSFREADAWVTHKARSRTSHTGPAGRFSGLARRLPPDGQTAGKTPGAACGRGGFVMPDILKTAGCGNVAPDGKRAVLPRDFGKSGGAHGR